MSRLRERYQKEVAPTLKKEFGYRNVMAIPKIEKIVVNMGLGEATQNAKIVDTGADEVARVTGQKPVTTRKKSIAQFKVRKDAIGAMVTLRGERMWEFLDRLISVAPARARLRGVSPRGFDGREPYTLGEGSAAVSGNRLHEGRLGARHEYLGGHDREVGPGVTKAAAVAGDAVPAELIAMTRLFEDELEATWRRANERALAT
jgi:large subunit ribosomal protein L5